MKKFVIGLFIVMLGLFMFGCGEAETILPLDGNIDPATQRSEQREQYSELEIVDLGCCVTTITVREMAILGANSVTHTTDDFILNLDNQ